MDKTNRAIKICRRLDEIDIMIYELNLDAEKDKDFFAPIFSEKTDLEKELDGLDVADMSNLNKTR
jgi:hypothetical protein